MTLCPFSLLGLRPCFDLSSQDLDQAYHHVLRLSHPDRLVQATGAEKLAASLRASEANQAYQTLKSFYRRACACLAAAGQPWDDKKMPSPDFLGTVMAYQEAVDEADATSFNEIEEAFRDLKESIREAFRQQAYEDVHEYLSRYTYLERLFKAVQAQRASEKRGVA